MIRTLMCVKIRNRTRRDGHGADQTLMTIEHEQLPADQVDPHQRGWDAIATQLAEALGARGR